MLQERIMKNAGMATSTLAALTLFTATGIASASPLYITDQANTSAMVGTSGSSAIYSFGQSFIPTLSQLNAVELTLGGFESTAVVRIRDGLAGSDGLSGPLLAESLPVFVDILGNTVFHFHFASLLDLTAGKTYVAELLIETGLLGVRLTSGDAYAKGQFLSQGFVTSHTDDYDLLFSEGVDIPEPASLALAGIGLLGLCGTGMARRRARTRTGRAALVVSTPTS
jgi:hypothetical protein